MKRIEELADFNNLKIHYLIRDFLFDYFYYFIDHYQCTDIKEFGAFFFLSDEEDFERYKETGLSQPFDKATPEFTEVITIKTNHEEISFIHCCFLFDNDYGISVFFEPDLMTESIKNNLLYDSSKVEVTINVSR